MAKRKYPILNTQLGGRLVWKEPWRGSRGYYYLNRESRYVELVLNAGDMLRAKGLVGQLVTVLGDWTEATVFRVSSIHR